MLLVVVFSDVNYWSQLYITMYSKRTGQKSEKENPPIFDPISFNHKAGSGRIRIFEMREIMPSGFAFWKHIRKISITYETY